MEAVGRWSSRIIRFKPERWTVDFGWTGQDPTYRLCGPKLTKDDRPFANRAETEMEISTAEVPTAVRIDLADGLRNSLASYVTDRETEIAKVLSGIDT